METNQIQHVDEFIDYGPRKGGNLNTDYARWVLLHFRQPATVAFTVDKFMADKALFCTFEGKRYRVTGASRLGDIWLAEDPNRRHGYDCRVGVNHCGEFSDTLEYREMERASPIMNSQR